MDKLSTYRQAIKTVLSDYASFTSDDKNSGINAQLLFDEQHDHYQLMYVGWRQRERIYGSVMHIDLIDGKVWLQYNGTEGDIAQDLIDLGVDRDDIVLGFRNPAVHAYTGLAMV